MRVLLHLILWRLGLASAESQTTIAERECLARYAAGRRRLAEIGVWHGGTTRRLRAAMAPDADLLAIDPYSVGRLGFSAQRSFAGSRREQRVHPDSRQLKLETYVQITKAVFDAGIGRLAGCDGRVPNGFSEGERIFAVT